jgi:hypothetical protein
VATGGHRSAAGATEDLLVARHATRRGYIGPNGEGVRGSAARDLRSDALTHEADDLAGVGVAADGRLGEDQLAVEGDLEPTLGRGLEGQVGDQRSPAVEQFVRQTDGTGNVVSGDAEFDGEVVPGIEHRTPPEGPGTSLPASYCPSSADPS